MVWFLKSVIFWKIFTRPNSPVVRQALSDRDVDGSNPGKGKKKYDIINKINNNVWFTFRRFASKLK